VFAKKNITGRIQRGGAIRQIENLDLCVAACAFAIAHLPSPKIGFIDLDW
jgi:hypothetical protein